MLTIFSRMAPEKVAFFRKYQNYHNSSCLCRQSRFTYVSFVLLCIGILLQAAPLCAASFYTVYFYNPESNVYNFTSLKTQIDIYLKRFGPYRFQPFNSRDMFEQELAKNTNGIVLVSSAHYRILQKTTALQPVLTGVVNGKTTQRKVLSTKKNIEELNELRGFSIASSGRDDYTHTTLTKMLGKKHRQLLGSFQILNVPKDIDALISVGFGMADVALTTEESIAMLMQINPRLHKKLAILAKGEATLLMIAAIPEQHDPAIRSLLKIIQNMPHTPAGGKRISMLGIDSWKELDETEKELLTK